MKIKNGKIIQATEQELFNIYLKSDYDEILSFPDYKRRCIELGTKIIDSEGEN